MDRPVFGVDAVPLSRAEHLLGKYGAVALRRTCTADEAGWVGDDPSRLAVLLALKEGGIKAIGGRPAGFTWPDLHLRPGVALPGEPVAVKDVLAGFERDLALDPVVAVALGTSGAVAARLGEGVRATARYGVVEGCVLAAVVLWPDQDETER